MTRIAMFLLWISTIIATLGVGKIPKAPGTFGSLLALLIWLALSPMSLEIQLGWIFLSFVVGVLAVHHYESKSKKHDPKEVVIDELIGMWITLLGASPKLSICVTGFLLFRIFDIWKPFPISWIDQKVPGAFGTILDDIVAGIFAYLCLNALVAQGSFFAIFNF